MAKDLLYIGIALIVIGWLALSWFAFKQIRLQKEYARMQQKWAEIKPGLVHKRALCRWLILAGMAILIISLVLS